MNSSVHLNGQYELYFNFVVYKFNILWHFFKRFLKHFSQFILEVNVN